VNTVNYKNKCNVVLVELLGILITNTTQINLSLFTIFLPSWKILHKIKTRDSNIYVFSFSETVSKWRLYLRVDVCKWQI
jgi:hypothetical protein